MNFDGTGSDVGGDAGDTLSYAWDLDDDGRVRRLHERRPRPWIFGDNGAFTVKLRVTNTAGYSDEAERGRDRHERRPDGDDRRRGR